MHIISCSRRTDIPRLFPDWLENCLAEGRVVYRAPRGGVRTVSLEPAHVHSMVLWSKDFAPMLNRKGMIEQIKSLHPFFHFTITGLGSSVWEPQIPAWPQAVKKLKRLVDLFGAGRVNWRFDPIVSWPQDDQAESNLSLFWEIGSEAATLGIKTCTFSFAHWYRKSVRRAARAGSAFIDPNQEEKIEMARRLAQMGQELGLQPAGCCQDFLEPVAGIVKARCIDGERLTALRDDGFPAPAGRDHSQRSQCGCSKSIDIGSYAQRCGDKPCVYCYAN